MPIFSILVPLWFIIISLVFSYLCKVLFSGFLQFKGNFVDGQNNSKYRDVALLRRSKFGLMPLFRVDNKAFLSLISVCVRGTGRLLQNSDSRGKEHSMHRGKWGGCHGNRV